MKFKCLVSLFGLLVVAFASAQDKKNIIEYLNVPGPVILNNTTFKLAWTSNPSENYYKQEYLPAQDNIKTYKKMVSVELLVSDATTEDLASAKMKELKQLKISNPLINYDIFKKNGEILLDFLISQLSADGKQVIIIERNVYRYKPFSDKNGKKGVMLFGASERSYGNDVDAFLISLKKNKPVLLNAVATFILPQVSIKK